MELSEIRQEIDTIDAELVKLFVRRMRCADRVAETKRTSGQAVLDSAREAEILNHAAQAAGPDFADDARRFFSDLMSVSRARQNRKLSR